MKILINRDEGILILSGGLTIHTFKEFHAVIPESAPQGFKDFEKAIVDGVENTNNVRMRTHMQAHTRAHIHTHHANTNTGRREE